MGRGRQYYKDTVSLPCSQQRLEVLTCVRASSRRELSRAGQWSPRNVKYIILYTDRYLIFIFYFFYEIETGTLRSRQLLAVRRIVRRIRRARSQPPESRGDQTTHVRACGALCRPGRDTGARRAGSRTCSDYPNPAAAAAAMPPQQPKKIEVFLRAPWDNREPTGRLLLIANWSRVDFVRDNA